MLMTTRSTRLGVERIEDRSVPSAVAYGDFNHDGRLDMAAVTSPTTITVSLANADGSYTVSAVLTAPTKQPVQDVSLFDYDGDGNLDINGSGQASGNKTYSHRWLGNGDGTFDPLTTFEGRWPPPPGHAKNWV
jgi:hypothetical protein